MADQKISELSSLTTPADADELVIVDTSATETKKISYSDLKDAIDTDTQLTDAEVVTALVNSTSITNANKSTIRTNIGAGTSNLVLGTTSTTALAGNTTIPTVTSTSVTDGTNTFNKLEIGTAATQALAGNTEVDDVSIANLKSGLLDTGLTFTTGEQTTFRTKIGAGTGSGGGGLDKYATGTAYTADDVIWNDSDDKIYVVTADISASANTEFSDLSTDELSVGLQIGTSATTALAGNTTIPTVTSTSVTDGTNTFNKATLTSLGFPAFPTGIDNDTNKNYNLRLTDSGGTETLSWAEDTGGGESGSDVPNHPNVDDDVTKQFLLQVADSSGTETESWVEIPNLPSGIATDTSKDYILRLTDASDTESLAWQEASYLTLGTTSSTALAGNTSFYDTIYENGTAQTKRKKLNFANGFDLSDDSTNEWTDVDFSTDIKDKLSSIILENDDIVLTNNSSYNDDVVVRATDDLRLATGGSTGKGSGSNSPSVYINDENDVYFYSTTGTSQQIWDAGTSVVPIAALPSYPNSKISSSVNGTNATDGHVLTADGSGGAAWEAVSGGGGSGIEAYSISSAYAVNDIIYHSSVLYQNDTAISAGAAFDDQSAYAVGAFVTSDSKKWVCTTAVDAQSGSDTNDNPEDDSDSWDEVTPGTNSTYWDVLNDNYDTISVADDILHTGDTDTGVRFSDNSVTLRTGGGNRIVALSNQIQLNSDTVMVTKDIQHSGDTDTKIEFTNNKISLIANNSTGIDWNGSTIGLLSNVIPSTGSFRDMGSDSAPWGTTYTDNIRIGADIAHDGDTNNKIAFSGDTQSFQTGGTERLKVNDSRVEITGSTRLSGLTGGTNKGLSINSDGDLAVTDLLQIGTTSTTALAGDTAIPDLGAVTEDIIPSTNDDIDLGSDSLGFQNLYIRNIYSGPDTSTNSDTRIRMSNDQIHFQTQGTSRFGLTNSLVYYNLPLRVAQIATASLPTMAASEDGSIVWDSTTDEHKYWTGTAWSTFSSGGGSGSDVPNHPNVANDTTKQYLLQVADSSGTETESWVEIPNLPSGISDDTNKDYFLRLTDSSGTETLTWQEYTAPSVPTVTSTSVTDGTNTFNKATLSSLGVPSLPTGIDTNTSKNYQLTLTDASDTETLSWTEITSSGSGSDVPNHPNVADDTTKQYLLQVADTSGTETESWVEIPNLPSSIATNTSKDYVLRLTDSSDTETLSWQEADYLKLGTTSTTALAGNTTTISTAQAKATTAITFSNSNVVLGSISDENDDVVVRATDDLRLATGGSTGVGSGSNSPAMYINNDRDVFWYDSSGVGQQVWDASADAIVAAALPSNIAGLNITLPSGISNNTSKNYNLRLTDVGGTETLSWAEDTGGGSVTVTSTSVSDGTNTFNKYTDTNAIAATIGNTSISNADKATYRTNLGAGTSNLVIGTTATTALAGDTTTITTAQAKATTAITFSNSNVVLGSISDENDDVVVTATDDLRFATGGSTGVGSGSNAPAMYINDGNDVYWYDSSGNGQQIWDASADKIVIGALPDATSSAKGIASFGSGLTVSSGTVTVTNAVPTLPTGIDDDTSKDYVLRLTDTSGTEALSWQEATTGSANDTTITLSAGTGLTGGGSFTTNQSSAETITLNVSLAATDIPNLAASKITSGVLDNLQLSSTVPTDGQVLSWDNTNSTQTWSTPTSSFTTNVVSTKSGPQLQLTDSDTAASGTNSLGQIRFRGKNDKSGDATYHDYASIEISETDSGDGTEDGVMDLRVSENGTEASYIELDGGNGRVVIEKDLRLNDVPDGTIVSGGNLGLDSNNNVVKDTVSGGGGSAFTTDVTITKNDPVLKIYDNTDFSESNSVADLGKINFNGNNGSEITVASIQSTFEGSTHNSGNGGLEFDILESGSLKTVFKVEESSDVGWNASFYEDVVIDQDSNDIPKLYLRKHDSTNSNIASGETIGSINVAGAASDTISNGNPAIEFKATSAITSGLVDADVEIVNDLIVAGDIVAENNIKVGGTGTANEFDDYEEGTWTPIAGNLTVSAASASGNLNANSANSYATGTSGSYVKIGRVVHCWAKLNIPVNTDTSRMQVTGSSLPFTDDNTKGIEGTVIGYSSTNTHAATDPSTLSSASFGNGLGSDTIGSSSSSHGYDDLSGRTVWIAFRYYTTL